MNVLFEGVYEDVDKLKLGEEENDDDDDDDDNNNNNGDTVGLQDLMYLEISPFNPEVSY